MTDSEKEDNKMMSEEEHIDEKEEEEEEESHDDHDHDEDDEGDEEKGDSKSGAAGAVSADGKEEKAKRSKSSHKKPSTQLPIARIKRIMKNDKDVKLISSDASLLITKATELFLEHLVQEAYNATLRDKRRILSYKDLSTTVKDNDRLEFLSDIIPQKLTL
ncbi:putative histone-like transcription factor [Cavenderia fasciculata]|uniref:Chromatin accessibility complex protein 1 n=1 Tax=Cavenderia fasciculata TaxID=261658 RepID=F4Q976_CACFS|nr:putative histone-like transcription factor [Cavenderia fasciculata]EGG15245.1 putative histone-like transcription factor [Cavenderia fasciculata]|eukprot:XP_004351965.1 putative histone-like transcription factor [Cavenderia fasciculata]